VADKLLKIWFEEIDEKQMKIGRICIIQQ